MGRCGGGRWPGRAGMKWRVERKRRMEEEEEEEEYEDEDEEMEEEYWA